MRSIIPEPPVRWAPGAAAAPGLPGNESAVLTHQRTESRARRASRFVIAAPTGTEVVYLAKVEDLPHPARPPLAGLSACRSVGISGTRLSAVLGKEIVGYIEVEVIEEGERLSRHGGWADIGNLHVTSQHRRQRVGTWLVGQAADLLALAQAERLLSYAWLEGQDPTGQDDTAYRAFLAASGFQQLTRTKPGWTRTPQSP